MRALAAVLLALGSSACTESGQVLSSAPEGAGGPRVLALATGDEHGCAIAESGLYCWGANGAGQLGLGDTQDRDRPIRVETELAFVKLAAGTLHTCALTASGEVHCAGDGARGQLGHGSRAAALSPVRVTLDRPVSQLSCNCENCCAIDDAGELWCWGKNEEGELGQSDAPPSAGRDADQLAPVPVGGARFRAVATGQGHTCALRDDGSLWCWGRNSFHELGPETREQVRTPIQVGSAVDWVAIATGQHHGCAVKSDRSLWCWGRNTAVQTQEGFPLGVDGEVVLAPTRVPLSVEVALLATDTFHTCIVDRDGGLWCWGRNVEGQLGLSGRELRRVPELIGTGFGAVDPGRFSTCALSLDKAVFCAGNNGKGELGTGDNVQRERLSAIAWFSVW